MSSSIVVWEPEIIEDSFVTPEENLALSLSVVRPPGSYICVVTNGQVAHRAEIEVRRAGYEIRDSMRWFYDSGDGVLEKTIVLGRKPLEGTVVQTLLKHGAGVINIDGCRVGEGGYVINTWNAGAKRWGGASGLEFTTRRAEKGKWPANILHDGSDVVQKMFGKTAFDCFYNTTKLGNGLTGLLAYLRLLIVPPAIEGEE
jgi:hypothetical protein